VQRGAINVSGRVTLGELLDRWLEHIESRGRAPKTIAEYRGKIERHIRPALGSVRLECIRPAQLDRQYATWQALSAE
jgi:hypothetical protein